MKENLLLSVYTAWNETPDCLRTALATRLLRSVGGPLRVMKPLMKFLMVCTACLRRSACRLARNPLATACIWMAASRMRR